MKRFVTALVGLLCLSVASTLPSITLAAAKQAICLVCQVNGGETEPEAVKATRQHEGKEYGFCSLKCAKAFDADPAAYVPPVFPRAAPEFALTGLDGSLVSKSQLQGSVVLLDFWATWCVPCTRSMPELEALHSKYAARGFKVVGVSIDEGASAPAKVKKFLRARGITYPIAIDSGKAPVWDAYRVKAVPAAFLLDREGRIIAQWTGAPPDLRQLESKLESLLATD